MVFVQQFNRVSTFIQQKPARHILLGAMLALSVSLFGVAHSAENHFGDGWQARPLLDTTKPVMAAAPESKQTPPAPQADVEAILKPAEPFIASIETKLTLPPKPGTPLLQRLNTLQAVLWGGPRYQDAGELLAKLADMFPQEAAQAHAGLQEQWRQSALRATSPTATSGTSQQAKKASKTTSTASASNAVPSQEEWFSYPASTRSSSQEVVENPAALTESKPAKKKRHWQSFNDDPFANDPFFQDSAIHDTRRLLRTDSPSSTPNGNALQSSEMSNPPLNNNVSGSARQDAAPSKLKALGQGLGSLAMMAGSLAGSYYMNKQFNHSPRNGYNPYYPYGTYGGYPYNPYYGNGNPYGAYSYDPLTGAYTQSYPAPYSSNSYSLSPYNPYGYGVTYSPY